MTTNNKYSEGKFYLLPKNMGNAVDNAFEFVILARLLERADTQGECFPSYRDLTQGIMSRQTAITCIKSLVEKSIVKISSIPYKANTYTIDYDRLVNHIDQSTTLTGKKVRLLAQKLTNNLLVGATSQPDIPTSQPDIPPSQPLGLLLVNHVDPNNNNKQYPGTRTSNKKQTTSSLKNINKEWGTGNEDTGNVSLKEETKNGATENEDTNKAMLERLQRACPRITVLEEHLPDRVVIDKPTPNLPVETVAEPLSVTPQVRDKGEHALGQGEHVLGKTSNNTHIIIPISSNNTHKGASFSFSLNNKDNDENDAKAWAGYMALLGKSYPMLNIVEEFTEFRRYHPDVNKLEDKARLFTVWCNDMIKIWRDDNRQQPPANDSEGKSNG